METGRLSFVLLVIALANLATDITRLALELAPPPASHESVPVQTRPGQQEISIQAPEYSRRTRELTPPRETSRSKKRSSRMLRVRADHHASQSRRARAPFSELRPDFSVNHPPWCWACQPMGRYVERRHFYER